MADHQRSSIRQGDYYIRNYTNLYEHRLARNRKIKLYSFATDFANNRISLRYDQLPWRVRKCLSELYPRRFPLHDDERNAVSTRSNTSEDQESSKISGIQPNKGQNHPKNLQSEEPLSVSEANEKEVPQEASEPKDLPKKESEGHQDSDDAAEDFLTELGLELWGLAYKGKVPWTIYSNARNYRLIKHDILGLSTSEPNPHTGVAVEEHRHCQDNKAVERRNESQVATAWFMSVTIHDVDSITGPVAADLSQKLPELATVNQSKRKRRRRHGHKAKALQGDSVSNPPSSTNSESHNPQGSPMPEVGQESPRQHDHGRSKDEGHGNKNPDDERLLRLQK
ncbi:MAG: hypothetical protein Q9174_001203 [Haloplaca sp. 1 TL-2023]